MSDRKIEQAQEQAAFKATLLAQGAHQWTFETAVEHLGGELKAQQAGGWIYRNLGVFAATFLGRQPYSEWVTAPVYASGLKWRPSYRYTHGFHNGSKSYRLPPTAESLVKSILAAAPETTFLVSHIGRDPVLWAVPAGIEPTMNVVPPEAEPVLVWDGRGRKVTIVLPPVP